MFADRNVYIGAYNIFYVYTIYVNETVTWKICVLAISSLLFYLLIRYYSFYIAHKDLMYIFNTCARSYHSIYVYMHLLYMYIQAACVKSIANIFPVTELCSRYLWKSNEVYQWEKRMWKINYKAVRSFINVITVSSLTSCVKYDRPTHKKVQQASLITPYLAVPDAEGFIRVNAFALINYQGTPYRTLSTANMGVQCEGAYRAVTRSTALISIVFTFYINAFEGGKLNIIKLNEILKNLT